MDGLLLIYAVVVALELVLSLVMLLVLLLVIAPRGDTIDEPVESRELEPARTRLPDDLPQSLRLAFRELSRGTTDVALLVHTRSLLERRGSRERH